MRKLTMPAIFVAVSLVALLGFTTPALAGEYPPQYPDIGDCVGLHNCNLDFDLGIGGPGFGSGSADHNRNVAGDAGDVSVGNGGEATATANGGDVVFGDINSGFNTGNVTNVSVETASSYPSKYGKGGSTGAPVYLDVYGGYSSNSTNIEVDASGGTAIADASGGSNNTGISRGGNATQYNTGTGTGIGGPGIVGGCGC